MQNFDKLLDRIPTFNWLSIEQEVTPPIIEALNDTVWGTPNKSMRYRHCAIEHKAKNIIDPYFVSLKRHEKIMGLGCFCKSSELCG